MISAFNGKLADTEAGYCQARDGEASPASRANAHTIYTKPGGACGHMEAGMRIAHPPGLYNPPCR